MYRTVLFDLDGTLTDPGLGITNSIFYALERMGYPLPPRQALYKFIGPPLLKSFQQEYGMTEDQAMEAIRLFREYFSQTGILENQVYPGIPAVLAALRRDGAELVLATSKPQDYAERILAHFDLQQYFSHIAGATMDERRVEKHEVIAYAMEIFSVDVSCAVMVGDREHDVMGARRNGLDCIGVLYGYGDAQELKNAGAMALAETPEALLSLLEQF